MGKCMHGTKPHKEMVLKKHGFSSPLTLVNPKGFHQNHSINYNYYYSNFSSQSDKEKNNQKETKTTSGERNHCRWPETLDSVSVQDMIGSSLASDWLIKQSKFQTNQRVMWNKTSESNPGIISTLNKWKFTNYTITRQGIKDNWRIALWNK